MFKVYILIRIYTVKYIAHKRKDMVSCIFKIIVLISTCASMQWILLYICFTVCIMYQGMPKAQQLKLLTIFSTF